MKKQIVPMQVNEKNLLDAIAGLRQYRLLLKEIPELENVGMFAGRIERDITLLNRIINRKYDAMSDSEYDVEIEKLLER